MPSFDIGPTRAVGAITSRPAREARENGVRQPYPVAVEAPVAPGPVAAGEPPVDGDRVSEIRKAVENGTYPVLPARIADAMIAAGVILRTGK